MDIKRVLLAEDDLDDQAFFLSFLEDRNDIHIMPIAENGVTLLDMLEHITPQDQLPDLIILDQNMPKLNGLQTLKLLKENTRYLSIPVIIYSTYTDQKLISECMGTGAFDVMTKPITKDGYNEIIESFLQAVERANL